MTHSHNPVRCAQDIARRSVFLKDVARANAGIFLGKKTRRLTAAEVRQLESQGNRSCSPAWDNVRVSARFIPDNIRNSAFLGAAVIGGLEGAMTVKGVGYTSGIFDSGLYDVQIGDNALVHRVGTLSRTALFENAAAIQCRTIAHSGKSSFANGLEICVAIETGGREVKAYAEMPLATAIRIATCRSDKKLLMEYTTAVNAYARAACSEWTIIGRNARAIDCACIRNACIGESGCCDNALLVEECTLLSSAQEPAEISHGALVRNALLQWGSCVTTMGMVTDSVLIEHSSVERQGKVSYSVIGANTAIGSGEVISCLLGPFVGFHHQALLIASFWPQGKGNASYGANIGSNHTSRAPDQENWIGEGFFFGLGSNIKFPADFTRAPFSILAANCQTLPQKIAFPFSLISPPAEILPGISPAFNEISPGWVLSDNIFAIRRNEAKYRARNKATRTPIEFETFRPEIIDLMAEARDLLDISNVKDLYTDKDIPGLGKNFMKENGRIKGMEAYSFYMRYYCLMGLFRKLKACVKAGKKAPAWLLERKDAADQRWEHERALLHAELPGMSVAQCLAMLKDTQRKIAHLVQSSKEKDDARGMFIIPDYAAAHGIAADNAFVKQTWEETDALCGAIDAISGNIG